MGYDTKTVESVRGEVTDVQNVPSKGQGVQSGIHVTLKTSKESIPVHLGPSWFLDEQKVKIARGDNIEVIGFRVDYNGRPAIIAKEIRKGDQMLKLRDDNGVPVWSRRGRQ